MPSGRGPWTVSDDGFPVGAAFVVVMFVIMVAGVAGWVERNAGLLEDIVYGAVAAVGALSVAGVGKFAWNIRRDWGACWKPARDRQIETVPVTVAISPAVVPAIEGRKTIPGQILEEEPAWTTSTLSRSSSVR